ncbi:MAG: TRAP transporter substrate-binding protein [Hydrogenophaga sp.]
MRWLFLTACLAVSVTHAQTNWTLASGYSQTSFHTQNILSFASDVRALSQGGLRIEVQSGGSLVKLTDIPKAVREGKVAAGETIMTNLVADMPIAGADAIPFVVNGYEDAKRLWGLQKPLIETEFARRGLKVLYAVPWPPQGLYSRVALKRPADLRGLTMRTYNQTTTRIAEKLGARALNVATADVSQAFATGKVDAMITSAITGVENRVWEHVRYYYPINAWIPKNTVFVNLKAFEGLKPDIQKALLDAAQRAETRGWALSQALEASSTAELARQGIVVETLPFLFSADFKRLGESFSLEWLRSVGPDANKIFIPYYTQR